MKCAEFSTLINLNRNVTTYTDPSAPDSSFVYYRVKAYRDTTASKYATANAIIGNAVYTMNNTNVSGCGFTFLDPGGTGNYGSASNVRTTISPVGSGNKVRVVFNNFRTHIGASLQVYDGPNSSSPYLGSYSGTTIPPVFESSALNGELTFIFYANGYPSDSGWRAMVSCFRPVTAPSNLTASVDSLKRVNLRWSDNATDETNYVIAQVLLFA